MGLMDKIKGELVDLIEWMDDDRSILAWRFPIDRESHEAIRRALDARRALANQVSSEV